MVDLSTTYLGLQLKHPVVASASPISKKLDGIRSLEDAGVQVSAFNTTRGRGNRFQVNFRNHRKIMVVDGTVSLVGSANMDTRSFRLNFEVHPLATAAFVEPGRVSRRQTIVHANPQA